MARLGQDRVTQSLHRVVFPDCRHVSPFGPISRLPRRRQTSPFGSTTSPLGVRTQTDNTKGDTARALLTPETEKLPPPPIPPKRWTP